MDEIIEDESPKWSVSIEGYEGPFDVLLDLIREKNMTIQEIKLATITDQYIKHINDMDVFDMDDASAFLTVLARLLEIKSKSLLPVEAEIEDENEIDDETLLKMQLEEYKLFKEAGEELKEKENIDRFYKQPDKNVGDARVVFNQFNLDKLLDAFAFVLMRTKDRDNPQEKKINRDRWTVADKIAFLNGVLKENDEINFFSLFDETYSKLEIITVFQAILEMLKFQKIEVVQNGNYQDILIKRKN